MVGEGGFLAAVCAGARGLEVAFGCSASAVREGSGTGRSALYRKEQERREREAAGAGSLEAGGEASRRSTSFVPARLQMRGTESRWAGPELPA